VVGLFEFLGFMRSWLQVFSEVFGDYLVNPNLDFKMKHAFFEVPQFQEVREDSMKLQFRWLWTAQAQPVIHLIE
jgi:hypothetical protein